MTFLRGMSIKSHAPYAQVGALLENFVVAELTKQITWSQPRVKLFHARTTAGIEVDCLLEDAAGRIVGIEIKNAQYASLR